MPLAWIMGVEWSECDEVGELVGLKTIVNEFVAYARLHKMMEQGILSVSSNSLPLTLHYNTAIVNWYNLHDLHSTR